MLSSISITPTWPTTAGVQHAPSTTRRHMTHKCLPQGLVGVRTKAAAIGPVAISAFVRDSAAGVLALTKGTLCAFTLCPRPCRRLVARGRPGADSRLLPALAELPLPLADDAKLWSCISQRRSPARAWAAPIAGWWAGFGGLGAAEGWRLLMGGGAALVSCVTRLAAQWNDCQARAVMAPHIFCGLGGVWVRVGRRADRAGIGYLGR